MTQPRLSDGERRGLVEAIHATDTMLVLAVTGGGVAAVTDLLSVAGASRTVLEARVPYAAAALDDLIGPDAAATAAGAVSATTAEVMSIACLARAEALCRNGDGAQPLLGVACTAAISTDRIRRGVNRAWIAVAPSTGEGASAVVVDLDDGSGDRLAEDRRVADEILVAIGRASGVGRGSP